MSRFGLKKTSESPAVPKQHAVPAQSNALSRNMGSSIGPIKANTQVTAAAHQSRNMSSSNPHEFTPSGAYAIQTDIDIPAKTSGSLQS